MKLAMLATPVFASCLCQPPGIGRPCKDNRDCPNGTLCISGTCQDQATAGDGGTADGGNGAITSVAVEPSYVEIATGIAQTASAQFNLRAAYSDGSSGIVGGTWTIDRFDLASIEWNTGRLTALGRLGGTVAITGETAGKSATGTAKIIIKSERIVSPAPADSASRFGTQGTDPAKTPLLVYPDDGVVMPVNMAAPLLQWNGGTGNSLWRVEMKTPLATATGYTTGRDFLPTDDEWRVVAEAAAGGEMTVAVSGTDAADPSKTFFVSAPVRIRIAKASFSGLIYYWALSQGRIVRIGNDYKMVDFWQPLVPGTTNRACVACHALSADGLKMTFTFDGGGDWSGIVDVRTPEPNLVGRNVFKSSFSTFHPNGKTMVGNTSRQLFSFNATTGAQVGGAVAGGVPGTPPYASMPKFSNDGKILAYARYTDNNWEIDYTASDLMFADVTVDASGLPSFSNHRQFIAGAANALRAISYPTFTSDGKYLAYQRGEHSRSGFDEPTINKLYRGQIYLTPLSAAAEIHLARLGPGDLAYVPSFSPFADGGYYWLVMMSRRNYGNVLRATAGQPPTYKRQIWVAAVDQNIQPGQDPSHPPFWLTGQDTSTSNMTAYWAPGVCKNKAADGPCRADIDCCTGFVCRPDGSGKSYCTPVDQACKLGGQSCTDSSQCCPGLQCQPAGNGKVCQGGVN